MVRAPSVMTLFCFVVNALRMTCRRPSASAFLSRENDIRTKYQATSSKAEAGPARPDINLHGRARAPIVSLCYGGSARSHPTPFSYRERRTGCRKEGWTRAASPTGEYGIGARRLPRVPLNGETPCARPWRAFSQTETNTTGSFGACTPAFAVECLGMSDEIVYALDMGCTTGAGRGLHPVLVPLCAGVTDGLTETCS